MQFPLPSLCDLQLVSADFFALVKKTGNSGKWKTTHQQAKMAIMKDSVPQPGDTGIWVTCARHQELKAGREVIELFNQV